MHKTKSSGDAYDFHCRFIQWADDRGIIENSSVAAQEVKLFEEFGELCGALARLPGAKAKGNATGAAQLIDNIKDGVGDVLVVLSIISAMQGRDLVWKQPIKAVPYTVDICSQLAAALVATRFTAARDLLNRIATQHGMTLEECMAHAWDEIKDRRGTLGADGIFVKESDQ